MKNKEKKTKISIGIDVKAPEKECTDKKCPFHGNIRPRGKLFTGTVIARDTGRTATVEWTYSVLVPKYERKEIRRTKIHVHNPQCIDAKIGDIVRIAETRPISKTKNFVIIENFGQKKGFREEMEAREEAKFREKKKEAAETANIGPETKKEEVKDAGS